MSSLKRSIYTKLGVPFYHITSSKSKRYVWFRIAKNGTRSLLEILTEQTHPEINGGYIPYLNFRYSGYFKFCFIRNPWDRVVSCYADKVVQKKMFPECWDKDFDFFVDFVSKQNLSQCDRHLRLQTSLVPLNAVDKIYRFENFMQHTQEIFEKLGIENELKHSNSSEHLPYQEYYNDRNKKLVSSLYQQDIEFGEYRFGKE